MLTAHSAWNRRFHLFLFCHCQRGDISKVGHLCPPFSNNKYCSYVAKSQDRWNKRGTIEALTNKEYTIERHKNWCD